jgi:HPt (histidine-containing phosphotransfer) domain-containing protein
MPESSIWMGKDRNTDMQFELDREAIKIFYIDVCDGKPEIIRELIEIYMISLDEMTRDLVLAQEEKDTKLLRRIAHSLKSSSQIFGANQLSADCESLEELARTENLADTGLFVERIINHRQQMHHLLRMELEQL